MAKPVPDTMETGSLGEAMARVIFQKIRWAPPVGFSQDIGDDLITFARATTTLDTQTSAYDLSAPVLMQVKSSARKYTSPPNKLGGEPGWWFTENSTDHFDHWLSFGLPYLLVLIDTTNMVAYWVEVRGPAIKHTGKGRKIFVPASQTVDQSNLDALNKVAVARRTNDLEGAAWTGKFADLPPADRLRYALVMPRLVAPHPNRLLSKVAYEEAAGMLMRNRLSDLTHLSRDRAACPKPNNWSTSREWGWRFVDALTGLLTTQNSAPFERLAKNARHRFERDACLIAQACIAYVSGDAEAAVSLLRPHRSTKPADRGWIQAQLAAMLLELNRPDKAAKAAQQALFALKSLDGDLTVSAIRGSAAAVLYSAAGIGRGDLAETISAQDNAGSWWRAEDVSSALAKDLELRFKSWAGDTSTHFLSRTPTTRLTTAAWNAAFSGAWGSWRHLSTQVAQLTLTMTEDPNQIAAGLLSLAFVGEKENAKAAASKIWMSGPVSALTTVVNELAATPWPMRAEGAAMGVLAAAGDLLTEAAAITVCERVLHTLKTGGHTRRFGGGWADRWNELSATLPRVLQAAPATSHKACAELVAEHISDSTEHVAASLIRVANGLRLSELTEKVVARLVELAKDRHDQYGLELLEILAPASDQAVAELRNRADGGSVQAFRSLLVTGSGERGDYLALGRDAARTVKQMAIDARGDNGTSSFALYQNDQLHDLTVAAYRTGDNRLWKAVTDALAAGTIAEEQLQRSVYLLAQEFQNLPTHVQRKLRKLAPTLRGSNFGFGFDSNEFGAAATRLNIATGNLSDTQVERELLALRRNDAVAFVKVLASWTGENKFPFLATMAVDSDARVRSQAAFSLVIHAHRFPADASQAMSVLRTALTLDDGCGMPDAVARAINWVSSDEFADLTLELKSHASAIVRSRFDTH